MFPPAQAEKRRMSGDNGVGLCHALHMPHIQLYTHLLSSLHTVRLLSQCPWQGRCPFIWTKPVRGGSLDLISKLLHQFISIHTTEQPPALPPTPHQQLSSWFNNTSWKKTEDIKLNPSDKTFLRAQWEVSQLLWQVSLLSRISTLLFLFACL